MSRKFETYQLLDFTYFRFSSEMDHCARPFFIGHGRTTDPRYATDDGKQLPGEKWVMFWITRGTLDVHGSQSVTNLKPGDVCLKPFNDRKILLRYSDRPSSATEMMTLIFEGDSAVGFARELAKRGHFSQIPLHCPAALHVQEVLAQKGHNTHLQLSEASTLVWGMLNALLPAYENQAPEDLAERARMEINRHYAELRSVTELAERLNASREHLSRRFTEKYGKQLHRYLLERKLEAARQLLAHSHLKQSAIAEMAGFGSESQFYRQILKKTGHTPADWRRKSAEAEATRRA